MKIGILTFHWAQNYGAVLQAYALQTVLSRMGHHVEIIDYRPEWSTDNASLKIPSRLGEAIKMADNLFRRKKFNKFRNRFLHLTTHRYTEGERIDGFDCVIVGSDQVFNPDIIAHDGSIDQTYLLNTVAEDIPKLAYAASFGNSTLAFCWHAQFLRGLSTFKAIGIREQSGQKIVENLGIDAVSVPDPTILLGDFSSISPVAAAPSDNYILNFIFQNTDTVQTVLDVVAKESNHRNYPIIGLYEKMCGRKGLYNPSPARWIETIRNAHFVITDSFHSTVFCILNHRPFISLMLDGWGMDWSERIKALLDATGLSDRLLLSPTSESVTQLYNSEIDWTDVDCRLESWRSKGLAFLNENL